jgi:CRISPR-associated protein Cas5d
LVASDDKDLKPAIAEDRDLGIMLYDMDFSKDKEHPQAMFFRAQMKQGVVIVPSKDSEEILK